MRKPTTGELGWVGLAAYVIAVDSYAWMNQCKGNCDEETMSMSFGRWLQKPSSRIVTGAAWAIVTGHLFFSLPLPGQTTLKNVVVNGTNKTLKKVGTVNGNLRPGNPR